MTKRTQSKRAAQVRRRTPKDEAPRHSSDLGQASALPSAFTLSTVDRRAAVERLLANLKASLTALKALLRENDDHWGYEDRVYRFYHQSFKVYAMQDALEALAPDLALNPWFTQIVAEGTGKSFELGHNKRWLEVTRPIVEAFFHARFFLDMAARYGKELEAPPTLLPSGWAAFLYLYQLR